MERSELLTACIAGVLTAGILAGNAVAMRRPVAAPTAPLPPTDYVLSEVAPEGPCHMRMMDPVRSCAGEIMVWGDSMAWAWSPLGNVANSRDACPPLLGWQAGKMSFHRRCREFNDATLPNAKRAREVYLAAAWLTYPLSDVQHGLDSTLSVVPRATIIGPTPTLHFKMPACLADGPGLCAISRASFDKEAEPYRKVLRAAAAKHGARYIEPVDYFCTSTECPALKDGLPLYWDHRHVSMSAVEGFVGDVRVLRRE